MAKPSTRELHGTSSLKLIRFSPQLNFPRAAQKRARELLRSALALADDFINQASLGPAAVLGQKGGAVTAKRGSEHFRKLAAKRKTRAGGRPRKQAE